MKTPYFITATGTDIGKTYLVRQLIRILRQQGRQVQAYKPVVSDFSPENLSDTGELLAALGLPATMENITAISPWRYKAPLTPSMAAKAENRTVDFDAIVNFCRDLQGEDLTLIEGVGGVMAPLTETHTILDWMAALKFPTLLVTGSYLGTLSHTLTALSVLQQADIPVAGVVLNTTPDSSVPFEETREILTAWLKGVPLISLPWGGELDREPLCGIFGSEVIY